ncbi:SIMPL domain-containing protein [Litorimonas cladophorae]|uniref:SIMPL domain-containing protein n=1 Tax=Litorimonas cladophorae TaxID=1220491 RepID=A0A918KPQ9_9PROT|nr:SIMPL domain-containing protein [Litorimonas cladophorae]GGX71320.1 SIMPL domain-containing protein [Litorimonas cladophorae]
MIRTVFIAPLLATGLLLTACNSGAPTYISTSSASQPTLDVSATGYANVAPDRAIVSAGVVQQGKTAGEAMEANAKLMTAVFAELKSVKIPKSDITTSQLSLQPQYDYRDNKTPVISGYEARNTVTVKSDDIEKIGPMLDALVRAGVNNINQVNFTVKDPKSALDTARQEAITEAREKAQNMATAAGVKLGPLMSLNESSGGQMPQPIMMRAAAMESSGFSTPISAGDQTLSVRVNMSYGIAQ